MYKEPKVEEGAEQIWEGALHLPAPSGTWAWRLQITLRYRAHLWFSHGSGGGGRKTDMDYKRGWVSAHKSERL